MRLSWRSSMRSLQLQVISGGKAVGTFTAAQRAAERVTNVEVLSGCFPR